MNPGAGLIILSFMLRRMVVNGIYVDKDEAVHAMNFSGMTLIFGVILVLQDVLSTAIWGTYLFLSR